MIVSTGRGVWRFLISASLFLHRLCSDRAAIRRGRASTRLPESTTLPHVQIVAPDVLKRKRLFAHIGSVVARILMQMVILHLDNACDHPIQKGAVMRDERSHPRRKSSQPALQPLNTLDIQKVRRFVQQQHIGLGEQANSQRGSVAPATRQFGDWLRAPRGVKAKFGQGRINMALIIPAIALGDRSR